ncbi:MAG: UxaA family hydrolase [Candidatus Bathyarchaeota archaeon]|nr:UxaA family hydrolase [Candidatus Bathyarchaeota archaeon]
MSPKQRHIVIDSRDNVATAITDLNKGETITTHVEDIILHDDIGYGHKFALIDIFQDDYVIKYGEPIGRATILIRQGDHVHVHNVKDIVNEIRKQ